MPAQRRIDLILESVRRLLRMGATPNLLNLLQKQHPADLAQIFADLPEKERAATFNILVDRNGNGDGSLERTWRGEGAELPALRQPGNRAAGSERPRMTRRP
jgi:magnesium transporter